MRNGPDYAYIEECICILAKHLLTHILPLKILIPCYWKEEAKRQIVGMKNLLMDRIYFSVSQKMYLPNQNICKRIGVVIMLFVLSYFLVLSWKPGTTHKYNKWKFDRYVGRSSRNMLNGQENQRDYMFQFLAKLISDKQIMFHICDELDVISCMNTSR